MHTFECTVFECTVKNYRYDISNLIINRQLVSKFTLLIVVNINI